MEYVNSTLGFAAEYPAGWHVLDIGRDTVCFVPETIGSSDVEGTTLAVAVTLHAAMGDWREAVADLMRRRGGDGREGLDVAEVYDAVGVVAEWSDGVSAFVSRFVGRPPRGFLEVSASVRWDIASPAPVKLFDEVRVRLL